MVPPRGNMKRLVQVIDECLVTEDYPEMATRKTFSETNTPFQYEESHNLDPDCSTFCVMETLANRMVNEITQLTSDDASEEEPEIEDLLSFYIDSACSSVYEGDDHGEEKDIHSVFTLEGNNGTGCSKEMYVDNPLLNKNTQVKNYDYNTVEAAVEQPFWSVQCDGFDNTDANFSNYVEEILKLVHYDAQLGQMQREEEESKNDEISSSQENAKSTEDDADDDDETSKSIFKSIYGQIGEAEQVVLNRCDLFTIEENSNEDLHNAMHLEEIHENILFTEDEEEEDGNDPQPLLQIKDSLRLALKDKFKKQVKNIEEDTFEITEEKETRHKIMPGIQKNVVDATDNGDEYSFESKPSVLNFKIAPPPPKKKKKHDGLWFFRKQSNGKK